MKPVFMGHEKSKMTILVQAAQVAQAESNGWYVVPQYEDTRETLKKSKTLKGGKNGENSRK